MRVAYIDVESKRVFSILEGPDLSGFPPGDSTTLAILTDYEGPLPAYWAGGTTVLGIPEKPSPYHTWGWTEGAWVVDLPLSKSRAWANAKQVRDYKEFGPFTYNGLVFDGDVDAQRRINLAVMGAQAALIAGQPWSMDWTLADNSVVTLTASEMVAVAQALGANIAAAHEEARLKRAAIEAATTIEELENI